MKKRFLLYTILFLFSSAVIGCAVQDETEALGFSTPSAILEMKEDMGDGVLYYIPNESIEADFMQSLSSFQGSLLVCGFSSEMAGDGPENTGIHLKLISMSTGEVIAQKEFSDMELPFVQDCGDRLAITDWGNGKVILLDENLQETDTYQVNCEYNSMYVSPDAQKIYVFTPDEGLQITEVASGKMEVELKDTVNLFISNECGNVVTFSYTDRKTQLDYCGALNIESGEIIDLPFDGSFYNVYYTNNTWMATCANDTNIHYIGNEEEIKTFEYNDVFTAIEIRPESGNLLSKRYDEKGFTGMTMHSAEGTFISHCDNSLNGADIQRELIWSEVDNGYFFIMMDSSEKDKLMFWDMSTEATGENLSFQPVQEENLPENAVSKELYERAKQIGDKHGVEIRIAEQMDEDYVDFKVEEILDESQINDALDILERELLVYPERYLKQLLYGNIRKIEIHLTGPVTNLVIPEGEINGFTSYAGFAQSRSGKAVIVLDINEGESLAKYLHHELFHLIDDKLAFDATIREEAMYAEEGWMKLNPEGFEYAGSTFVLPDEIYNEEYDVWFIDMYARTMPREDRATIMEYAMMGDYNMFIAAPHRQEKLEYLNKCIRDAFDTTGWPEKTVWEETLENSY